MTFRPHLSPQQAEFYHSLPKVDLHRHLEGSLRVGTMQEVIRDHEITLPRSPDLSALVQMQANDPSNFETFLSKFQTLRLLYRSPEIIRRVTREAIVDAAADNVRYLELRFTPAALSRVKQFPLAEVMDWVLESAAQASQECGIMVGLIVSINRHEPVALGEETARLAVERRHKGIVGLDLTGNEAQFAAGPFLDIFRRAKADGLKLTVHAGEWGGADNIRQALEDFGADRIGHGVRVLEDKTVVAMVAKRGTPFEVCLTSNFQSGVVAGLDGHYLPRLLADGVNITLNTDDPSISGITLSDEYALACEVLGITRPALGERILAAARAAFLPDAERQQLVESLHSQLIGTLFQV
jgi:adenosine deaminase